MVYMYHSFLIRSSADGHLGCFHCPGNYKQCFDEHWGARVSFNSGFLGVYAQERKLDLFANIFVSDFRFCQMLSLQQL